ncbi:MAG: hypothetical protein ACRD4A_11480 [Candidatus Acidiferrales bacterium]
MHPSGDHTYDIFQRLPDGTPIWVEAVQGEEPARQRMAWLAAMSSWEYFLYDAPSNKVMAHSKPSRQASP